MHIRLAENADIAAMHRIRLGVRENRLSEPARLTEDVYLPYVADRSVWVCEVEGRVSGFAALDVPAASVWALFVDPRFDGEGLGSALHQRLVEAARARGLLHLWLSTGRGTRAEAFYEAKGWTRAGNTGAGEVRLELGLRTSRDA